MIASKHDTIHKLIPRTITYFSITNQTISDGKVNNKVFFVYAVMPTRSPYRIENSALMAQLCMHITITIHKINPRAIMCFTITKPEHI